MRRLALALTLVSSLAAALPAAAQDTPEARLAAARAHTALVLQDLDIADVVRTMYAPLLDQLRSAGRAPTEDQLARLDALYQETMAAPLLEILGRQDQVMAEIFTLEEIEALAAFYASPVGRQVMTKLPRLIEAQQPEIMAMVQREVPRLIPQIQAILAN